MPMFSTSIYHHFLILPGVQTFSIQSYGIPDKGVGCIALCILPAVYSRISLVYTCIYGEFAACKRGHNVALVPKLAKT